LQDDPLSLIYAVFAAIIAAVVAAIATRVRLLPDVIDLSLIPTGAGLGSLVLVGYGALRRFDSERIGRLALFGTLVGGVATAAAVLLGWFIGVLS
jgi:hypothetical protein